MAILNLNTYFVIIWLFGLCQRDSPPKKLVQRRNSNMRLQKAYINRAGF